MKLIDRKPNKEVVISASLTEIDLILRYAARYLREQGSEISNETADNLDAKRKEIAEEYYK